jgi:uncharacterized protein (DUF983 family)
MLMRCPRCGGSGWWLSLTKRVPRCRSCGYRYEREPGFSLGAITMNITVTFAALAVVLAVGIVSSYPHIAVVPMLVAGGLVVVVLPVLCYPMSYTVWAAIDLLMHPLDAGEAADAEVGLLASQPSFDEDA